MRSYFNGATSSPVATPPPGMTSLSGGLSRRKSGGMMASTSGSLPKSPQVHGSTQGGSNQEVYVNIYQNTNHPSLFVSVCLLFLSMFFFARHAIIVTTPRFDSKALQ